MTNDERPNAPIVQWPRTLAFHAGDRGSSPLGSTPLERSMMEATRRRPREVRFNSASLVEGRCEGRRVEIPGTSARGNSRELDSV